MENCSPKPTPMEKGLQLPDPRSIQTSDEDAKLPYLSAGGSLIWLLMTRADIAFISGVICRYFAGYNSFCWQLVKRVFRYLKKEPSLGLVFHAKERVPRFSFSDPTIASIIVAYSDSDYAGREHDSKSTSGYLLCFKNVGTVSYKCTTQKGVAQSSNEAEFNSAVECAKAILWHRNVMHELSCTQPGATILYLDNQSAIKLGKNPVMHARTKHFRVKQHFIQDLVNTRRVIKLDYVSTEHMPADLLNKAHAGPRLRYLIGLVMGTQQTRP